MKKKTSKQYQEFKNQFFRPEIINELEEELDFSPKHQILSSSVILHKTKFMFSQIIMIIILISTFGGIIALQISKNDFIKEVSKPARTVEFAEFLKVETDGLKRVPKLILQTKATFRISLYQVKYTDDYLYFIEVVDVTNKRNINQLIIKQNDISRTICKYYGVVPNSLMMADQLLTIQVHMGNTIEEVTIYLGQYLFS